MRLVLSTSICVAEFGGEAVPELHVEPLKRSRSVELATAVKGEGLPKGSRLLKVYATSPEGARRVVHLLAVAEETLFLLFYRDKKDSVGANVTNKNPTFRKQLHKHLQLLQRDLESGEFEVWEDEPEESPPKVG
jgi:hypothetical protein